jgi:hypothetical protein
MHDYSVVVNPAKCVFGEKEVQFLEYLVSGEGTQPLPEKVEAIRQFSKPVTVQELRQFLGMINFYRRFIPHVAETQAPLNEVLKGKKKGNVKVEWTPSLDGAFVNCKDALARTTLLTHPDHDATLALMTDASANAIGAALQQHTADGRKPLNFYSRKLSVTEIKYSAYDRELLTIYCSVRRFRHMLEGRDFCVLTDHKPFTFALR